METLLKDIRYGARSLLKRPAFAAIAVVTLALGIGANTAIFSVVNTVLIRPFPYRDAQRVITLWQNNVKAGVSRNDVSPANFLDWQEQSRSFASMAGIEPFGFSMIGNGEPERFGAWLVTDRFFETIGSNALYGRTFNSQDYQAGNERVVVIGYGLWQRRFGGDPNLIGQKLTLNGQPYVVVGVMPKQFEFPAEREVWAPRVIRERDRQLRGPTYWNVIARLQPGVTIAQAQAEMNSIARNLEVQYPDTNGGMGTTIVSLPEQLTGNVRSSLWILLGAVGFVLLIACGNVANLLLVRGAERTREFAVRSALGAARARLVRQLLTESILLALLGGTLGVMFASWGVKLILAFNTAKIPRIEYVSLDWRVLVFALGLSLLTAVLFGLIPAAQFSSPNLRSSLTDGSRGAVGKSAQHWVRNSLVVTEVAVALMLLTGAGLLVRSFVSVTRVDPGFETDRLVALQVFLSRNYQKTEEITGFFDQSLEKIKAVPGVEAAAIVASPPFINLEQDAPFTIQGHPPPPKGSEPSSYYTEVSADYLRTLNVPLRQGRFFTGFDRGGSASVAVINQAMAERFFVNEDPIGKKVTVMFDQPETREIVGVVGNVLHSGLDSNPRPELFVPHSQSPNTQMTFVVKTTADPASLLPAVKNAIREVNHNQTFAKTATMKELVADSLKQRRFNLFLLVSFALVALILAGVGVYGSINYSTKQRTQEIGLRMALGAQSFDVLRLIVGQGLVLSLLGVGIGLVGSFGLTRLMRGLLFGISPTDPLTFAAIALLLTAIGVVASWIPARRAMKVDPLEALRYE
ncbi:MAG TPA: ABC transporter permease [Pyrinomonadaceae bacterium]|nr:ABC transporter permease [Pyrinomonadaceae bacterium]